MTDGLVVVGYLPDGRPIHHFTWGALRARTAGELYLKLRPFLRRAWPGVIIWSPGPEHTRRRPTFEEFCERWRLDPMAGEPLGQVLLVGDEGLMRPLDDNGWYGEAART